MSARTILWLAFAALAQVVRSEALVYGEDQQPLVSSPQTRASVLYHLRPTSNGVGMHKIAEVLEDANLDVWHLSPERGAYVYIRDVEEERTMEKILDRVDSPAVERTPISAPPPPLTDHAYPASALPWNTSLSHLPNSTYHNTYHPYLELHDMLYALHDAYPDVVTIVEYGRSSEGRPLLGAVIREEDEEVPSDEDHLSDSSYSGSTGRKGEADTKLAFVISGAQHSREWIATSTASYLAHALSSNASEPGSLRSLLKHFDFHIIPTPNPDGYVYSWEHDRFWHKNRQPLGLGVECTGIDLNRNWGYKWRPVTYGDVDLSASDAENSWEGEADLKKKKHNRPKPTPNPCSASFPGSRPFQAPEVNALANYVTAIGSGVGGAPGREIGVYIDLRSFGQMLSTPYSFSCQRMPRDNEDQLEAAMGAVKRMKAAHGMGYKTGRLCELLYNAGGNIMDYMYKREGIKYSYSLHLRDTGTYGFLIPPEWIRPVGEETAQLVTYLAHFVARQRQLPDAP
ncbi:hypothetical protein EV122DRAFT_214135 [Schizophyllum commune]